MGIGVGIKGNFIQRMLGVYKTTYKAATYAKKACGCHINIVNRSFVHLAFPLT